MHTYNIMEQGQKIDKAEKSLILLHGRGGSAKDILSLAPVLCDDSFYIVAPQATNNSWYPYGFMAEKSKNEPWMTSAIEMIQKIIDDISIYIPAHKIYVAGFSQGACLSLEVTARHAKKYGGVIAFTGGLIGENLDQTRYTGNYEGTKVFIGTSQNDPFIPLPRVQQSKIVLEELGANVTLKIYPGNSHTVTKEEINWVKTHILMN